MSILYHSENKFYSEFLENALAFLTLDEAAYLNDADLSVDAIARA